TGPGATVHHAAPAPARLADVVRRTRRRLLLHALVYPVRTPAARRHARGARPAPREPVPRPTAPSRPRPLGPLLLHPMGLDELVGPRGTRVVLPAYGVVVRGQLPVVSEDGANTP